MLTFEEWRLKYSGPGRRRKYSVDKRHLLPLLWDCISLGTVGLLSARQRKHLIQAGRDTRQHAFDLRDPLPLVEHADIALFLGCSDPQPIVLPPVGLISLAGLGFVMPYTLLAAVVSALQPRTIFETGTFRGVGALTMALNAPNAEIYTVDLPDDDDSVLDSMTRGDQAWVVLSRGNKGVAFSQHPAAERIHMVRANSLTMDATQIVKDVDFCFIDGGHTYECVKADTENALKILSPNGVIMWDDYTWFTEGVSRYLLELAKTLPLKRIVGSQFVIYKREA